MTLLITFLIGLIIFGVIWLFADWVIHIDMVKENCDTYGWAGFKKFKEHFDKTEWEYDNRWENSLFGKSHYEDRFFASIIKFNRVGMIMNNPISFLLARIYVVEYIHKNHKDEIVKNPKKEKIKVVKEEKEKKKLYKW